MVVVVCGVVWEESVGVRDGFRVIDGDGHMMEPTDIWDRYVEGSFRDRAPKVVGHRSKTRHVYGPCEIFPGGGGANLGCPQRPTHFEADFPERFGEAYESYWSLSSRLQHMDEEGTDIMVGFPTTGGVATSEAVKDPALQAALCRAYNNWGVDYCADSGGRVKFIGIISVKDLDGAVREVGRLAGHGEVAAVVLPAIHAQGRLFCEPEYDRLWAAFCAAGFAACFHGGSAQQTWFRPWTEAGLLPTAHSLSFPVEAMAAVGTVIDGGVLERFPELRTGFYGQRRLGAVVVVASGRAFRGPAGSLLGGSRASMKPSEYFARQCFVALDPTKVSWPWSSSSSTGRTCCSTVTILTPIRPSRERSRFLDQPISERPNERSSGTTPSDSTVSE